MTILLQLLPSIRGILCISTVKPVHKLDVIKARAEIGKVVIIDPIHLLAFSEENFSFA